MNIFYYDYSTTYVIIYYIFGFFPRTNYGAFVFTKIMARLFSPKFVLSDTCSLFEFVNNIVSKKFLKKFSKYRKKEKNELKR